VGIQVHTSEFFDRGCGGDTCGSVTPPLSQSTVTATSMPLLTQVSGSYRFNSQGHESTIQSDKLNHGKLRQVRTTGPSLNIRVDSYAVTNIFNIFNLFNIQLLSETIYSIYSISRHHFLAQESRSSGPKKGCFWR
jgi:hypothetical protein